VVLIGPGALAGLGGAGLSLLGQLGCLGAVTMYACGSIMAKRAPRTDAVRFGAAVLLIAFAIVAPVALVWERPFAADPSPRAWTGLIWLGLLSTALAQVLLLQVLQRAGPPFLSMVNFMIPVWALGFGVLLLGEAVEPRALAALLLIFTGVAVAQGLIGGPRLTGARREG
jgi:drug/metabolite transporter (DMT)-like permease